jgi:hypothetical protein
MRALNVRALILGLVVAFAPTVGSATDTTDAPVVEAPAKKLLKRGKKKKKNRLKRQHWPTKRPDGKPPHPPKLGNIPFPEGERLKYDIKMFDTLAGEAIFAVGARIEGRGRNTVPLAAFLRSSPFLSKFYRIDDTLKVTVNEANFLPMESSFRIRENGKKLDYITKFKQFSRLLLSTRTKAAKILKRNFTTVAPVYDALSGIYAMRRLELQTGQAFELYVWDGRRERLVQVKVVGDERIWTKLGWFDCTRIEMSSDITGGFIKKSALDIPATKGTVWLAKDAARTPVKVSTPTKLGTAEAVLVKRWVEPKT